MKLHIGIVIGVVILVAVIGYFVGKGAGAQVVDAEGKHVKGHFVSSDGKTATLKA